MVVSEMVVGFLVVRLGYLERFVIIGDVDEYFVFGNFGFGYYG